uniref:DUF7705 domain-containing protein n=1 Tax=Noccaea caerulescens TaxID=107243 RepID=A0A1J3G9W4_NOCCA
MKQLAPIFSAIILLLLVHGDEGSSSTAVGDPGMKRDGLRVAFEAWNFCNEVGFEAPHMGSPRAADCFDISSKPNKSIRKYQSNITSKLLLILLLILPLFASVLKLRF